MTEMGRKGPDLYQASPESLLTTQSLEKDALSAWLREAKYKLGVHLYRDLRWLPGRFSGPTNSNVPQFFSSFVAQ